MTPAGGGRRGCKTMRRNMMSSVDEADCVVEHNEISPTM
jgi:hypothetical protein